MPNAYVRDSVFDRVVQSLEFGVLLGRTLAQFGDMRRSALGALLATSNTRERICSRRLCCNKRCSMCSATTLSSFSHRSGAALAAGLVLPSLGRASVIPVALVRRSTIGGDISGFGTKIATCGICREIPYLTTEQKSDAKASI